MEITGLIILPFEVENTEGWRFRVLVAGEDFPAKPINFAARIGDSELQGARVDDDGTGFSGYLVDPPENGSRLFVSLSGQDEIDTGFTLSTPDA
jgi:hypothetical protein